MESSWKEMIDGMFKQLNDSWDNVEHCTLSNEELNEKFNSGYGGIDGKPFTIWTWKYVYFPTIFDGSEGVAYVKRNPGENPKPTIHLGGY